MADPIQHVIVLTLENHSFDQMLGCFGGLKDRGVEGISPAHSNLDADGTLYRQEPATERQMLLDPHHEVKHVAVQLADGNAGFVRDFSTSFPESTREARQFIMGYYPLDFLPALHTLARDFTICDHWFASVPGPTWPNRFFALTGTSSGRVNMPDDGTHKADLPGYFEQDQITVFDRLTEQGRHWKIYFHDIPQSWVLKRQRLPENAARYFYIDEFFEDCRGPEAEFPEFCFIEPDFMGVTQNDDHPPHDVMKAEKLIADVYNALRANVTLWRTTLLVVFYDEHGGFFDHVVPPPAVPPDLHREEYTFDRLGVRVPALLVSPWVDRRIDHTRFDHTSVLKYLTEKWDLGPLGERTKQATSIACAIGRGTLRDEGDVPLRIDLTIEQLTPPDPDLEEKACGVVSEHHEALRQLGHWLWTEVDEGLPRAIVVLDRCIEKTKSWIERYIRRRRGATAYLQVSIAEPDKITRNGVRTRDQVVRFIMRRKLDAIPVLAARIGNEALSEREREHAVRTLALISRRPFHREHDRFRSASRWLQEVGRGLRRRNP